MGHEFLGLEKLLCKAILMMERLVRACVLREILGFQTSRFCLAKASMLSYRELRAASLLFAGKEGLLLDGFVHCQERNERLVRP